MTDKKQISLYDFLQFTKKDFDVYDTVYDAEVVVCYSVDEKTSYDKFCNNIIKKVEFKEQTDDVICIADWTGFINKNIDKFREFSRKYWFDSYEDDEDELIYQWIIEINNYMAGCVSEKFYDTLVDFVDTLKPFDLEKEE